MKYIGSFLSAFIIIFLIKLMTKDSDDKNVNKNIIILDCKKSVKIIMTIFGIIEVSLLPILCILSIIKGNIINRELFILGILFLPFGLITLIGMKYQKIIYKDGTFIKKNVFGKEKKYKLIDAIKVTYVKNFFDTITLFYDNNKKLEITSFLTNVNLVLGEMKSKNINIDTFE